MSDKWTDFDEYLTAEMLDNQDYRLTIASVAEGKFYARERGENVTKPVLFFRETPKGLVLTNVNRRRLMRLFGDERAACVGKQIVLCVEQVSAFGQTQDVIRINVPAVTSKPAHQAKQP